MEFQNSIKDFFVSGLISVLLFICKAIVLIAKFMMSLLSEPEKKSGNNMVQSMEPTEISQKYWYLEGALKLEEEINRNIGLISTISAEAEDDDDLKMVVGCELSKAKMLKKGKLKMFRDLCLVALKEIPPIENDKEVTVDDLDGFWCLLDLEIEKHRQAVDDIIKPKDKSNELSGEKISDSNDNTDEAVARSRQEKGMETKTISKVPLKSLKSTAKVTKAAMKVQKSNIDERNRKYMERMKKLREKKTKTVTATEDKENQNPKLVQETPVSLKLKAISEKSLQNTPNTKVIAQC